MENLSLKDRRRRQSIAFDSRTENYDRYFSRLPTPDESTPSHRSSDDERRNKVTRRHSPDHSNLRALGYSVRFPEDSFAQAAPRRTPDSPPYQPSDAQKPSLPPLKTILANSLTSPPRSPTFYGSSVQPSPQEPAYTSATYKPPSLYPQKKQRTEYLLEPVPPISANYASNSPSFESDAFDRRSRQPAPSDTIPSPRGRFGDSRRRSLQPNAGYPSTTSPRPSERRLQPFFIESSANDAQHGSDQPYKQPLSAATSSPEYGTAPAQQSLRYEISPQGNFERRFERRDSTQASYDPVHTVIERQYNRQGPRGIDPRLQHTAGASGEVHDSSHYARRVDLPSIERQAEGHYNGYQSNQPSFFMPSQYDYRHGRARKRSNLPKQSTEIMKTWFDQNITNPYPSEEQKAIFSNATGISMTQVSNWFINHRRRCPEMREKRERARGRECEV